MKNFLLLLTYLFSTSVFPAVGDVYFCVTDNYVKVTQGDVEQYKAEKFKFKWTETEIIYSDSTFFADGVGETITVNYPSLETFRIALRRASGYTTIFREGKLVTTMHIPDQSGVWVIISTCEKS